MRKLVVALGLVPLAACSTNAPQYVHCAPMGPAPMDSCTFVAGEDDGTGNTARAGQLHIPVMPEADWDPADRARRAELQRIVDTTGAVTVPVVRLEHYDISVEWIVRNLSPGMGTFRVDLNGANEEAAYDSTMIMRADDRDPPAPPLAGDIPISIGPMGTPEGTVSGVFREDQLREAAIDLDQITRGNVNPFAAMLTINKGDDAFQPRTPTVYDPATGNTTGGEPSGPEVPEAAWRQIVRVDINFRPDRRMEIEFAVRLRVHTPIIHDMGLNAPAGEITVYDPPYYTVTLP